MSCGTSLVAADADRRLAGPMRASRPATVRRQIAFSCHPADIRAMRTLKDLLDGASWLPALTPDLRARVESETVARLCPSGSLACRRGERVDRRLVRRGLGA